MPRVKVITQREAQNVENKVQKINMLANKYKQLVSQEVIDSNQHLEGRLSRVKQQEKKDKILPELLGLYQDKLRNIIFDAYDFQQALGYAPSYKKAIPAPVRTHLQEEVENSIKSLEKSRDLIRNHIFPIYDEKGFDFDIE